MFFFFFGLRAARAAEGVGGARLRPRPHPLVLLSGLLVLRWSRFWFAIARPLPPVARASGLPSPLNVHRFSCGGFAACRQTSGDTLADATRVPRGLAATLALLGGNSATTEPPPPPRSWPRGQVKPPHRKWALSAVPAAKALRAIRDHGREPISMRGERSNLFYRLCPIIRRGQKTAPSDGAPHCPPRPL